MPTLTQINYLIRLIKGEKWFQKYQSDNLDLFQSLENITIPQYKKCLALLFNSKPETEEFIKQFFIYESTKL